MTYSERVKLCNVFYVSYHNSRRLLLPLTTSIFMLCMLWEISSLSYKMPFIMGKRCWSSRSEALYTGYWACETFTHRSSNVRVDYRGSSLPPPAQHVQSDAARGVLTSGMHQTTSCTFTCEVEEVCLLAKTNATWWLKVKWRKGSI